MVLELRGSQWVTSGLDVRGVFPVDSVSDGGVMAVRTSGADVSGVGNIGSCPNVAVHEYVLRWVASDPCFVFRGMLGGGKDHNPGTFPACIADGPGASLVAGTC